MSSNANPSTRTRSIFPAVAAACLAMSLGACDNPNVASVVKAAQTATALACGFLPTASAIANVLTKAPEAQDAQTIAKLICANVNKPATYGVAASFGDQEHGKIDGLPLTGHWKE